MSVSTLIRVASAFPSHAERGVEEEKAIADSSGDQRGSIACTVFGVTRRGSVPSALIVKTAPWHHPSTFGPTLFPKAKRVPSADHCSAPPPKGPSHAGPLAESNSARVTWPVAI